MAALHITLIDVVVKVTTWGLGIKKKLPVGPAPYRFPQTLFLPVTQHFWFKLTYFSLFTLIYVLLVINDSLSLYFPKYTFFRFVIRSVIRTEIRSVIRSMIRFSSIPVLSTPKKEQYYSKPRYVSYTYIKPEVECTLV